MKIARAKLFFAAVLLLAMNVILPTAHGQDNLLVNPGFEPPFDTVAGVVPGQIAQGWSPWSVTVDGSLQPEYYPSSDVSSGMGAPRILSGTDAQQYFTFFSSHVGGVYQRVSAIAPGSTLTFSISAWVWSTSGDDPAVSDSDAAMTVEVGIDPMGGQDGASADIVWSEPVTAFDAFTPLSVSATAISDSVTVFVRSTVGEILMNNVVYLDDASLVVTTPAPENFVEATVEMTPESVVASMTEGTPEATMDVVVEATAEALPEMTIEPTAEVMAEMTAEATPEAAVVEMTPEMTVEEMATAEATAEMTADAVIVVEPTAEPVAATLEPTAVPPTDVPTVVVPTAEPPTAVPTVVPPTIEPTMVPTMVPPTAVAEVVVVDATATPIVVEAAAATTRSTPVVVDGAAAATPSATIRYVVQYGDSLSSIASRYRTTVRTLAQLNRIVNPNLVYAGTVLLIPTGALPTATPTRVPTSVPPTAVPTATTPATRSHRVQPGDTLYVISIRYNVRISDLIRLNRIVDANRIFVGQVLQIP